MCKQNICQFQKRKHTVLIGSPWSYVPCIHLHRNSCFPNIFFPIIKAVAITQALKARLKYSSRALSITAPPQFFLWLYDYCITQLSSHVHGNPSQSQQYSEPQREVWHLDFSNTTATAREVKNI